MAAASKGIMGAVADGALRAGGKVTGIIPRFLMTKEATQAALQRLDELVVTENMHQRKHTMFEKSDAFVALPGGIGTVEEIIEIMTWAQLGHHRKPIVFANIEGFWNPMLALHRPHEGRGLHPHRPSGEPAGRRHCGSDRAGNSGRRIQRQRADGGRAVGHRQDVELHRPAGALRLDAREWRGDPLNRLFRLLGIGSRKSLHFSVRCYDSRAEGEQAC